MGDVKREGRKEGRKGGEGWLSESGGERREDCLCMEWVCVLCV
jgi:hypothetical protein